MDPPAIVLLSFLQHPADIIHSYVLSQQWSGILLFTHPRRISSGLASRQNTVYFEQFQFQIDYRAPVAIAIPVLSASRLTTRIPRTEPGFTEVKISRIVMPVIRSISLSVSTNSGHPLSESGSHRSLSGSHESYQYNVLFHFTPFSNNLHSSVITDPHPLNRLPAISSSFARTRLITASPTTEAAGTAHMSERSISAFSSCQDSMSTLVRGR